MEQLSDTLWGHPGADDEWGDSSDATTAARVSVASLSSPRLR